MSSTSGPGLGLIATVITPSDATVYDPPLAGVYINCTIAGNLIIQRIDTTNVTIPVSVGMVNLPFAARQVRATGDSGTKTIVGYY